MSFIRQFTSIALNCYVSQRNCTPLKQQQPESLALPSHSSSLPWLLRWRWRSDPKSKKKYLKVWFNLSKHSYIVHTLKLEKSLPENLCFHVLIDYIWLYFIENEQKSKSLYQTSCLWVHMYLRVYICSAIFQHFITFTA